jgi:CRISPR/Cas system CSM-associated protein Csm3 (group 7 of RAMP superfamily)
MSGTPQRLDVSFQVCWRGRWHVGSGHSTAAVDRQVRRRRRRKNAPGTPFVPGAQLKGVLRHHCERLAAALGCPVVSPHSTNPEGSPELLGAFRPLARSPLLIDRLFGSRYQGECLFVDDALPPESKPESPVALHSRTALDRVSGTAKAQTLFVAEVAEGHGLVLESRLRARHRPGVLTSDGGFPHEYALLLAALLDLEWLGGDKSAGLGACQIKLSGEVRWNGAAVALDEALACLHEEEWFEMLRLVRGEEET